MMCSDQRPNRRSIATMLGLLAASGCIGAETPRHSSSLSAVEAKIQCYPAPQTFPTFDKACMAAQDCSVALHQTDCCGSLSAIGISLSERARFDEAEGICENQYPPCGCAGQYIQTEDGSSVYYSDDIGIACQDGQCMTFAADQG